METQILAKKKISDDQRTIEVNPELIPLDLVTEIFKGLPIKSLARFLCVSKQYATIIRNRDFMKSYLFKSSSTLSQSLMFTFESKKHNNHLFFSSTYPQNLGEPLSFSVATYHMKCHSHPYKTVAPSVHGLICYGTPYKLMLYNPSTRQRSTSLPKIVSLRIDMYHYLGYDPIDGDYKLLCMTEGKPVSYTQPGLAQDLRVMTLGNENSWRMVQDCAPHTPGSLDICIDGVLYYKARFASDPRFYKSYQAIMSFDVRSEKFDLIKVPETAVYSKLTCYEGKLAIMYSFYPRHATRSTLRNCLWVLVDAAKHEWSEKVFVLPCWDTEWSFEVFCFTDAGEFVLAPQTTFCVPPPFYVLCYDPKKKQCEKSLHRRNNRTISSTLR